MAANAAADSFFSQFPAAAQDVTDAGAGTVVNLAAARRAGLFVDASELDRPAVSISVTSG